MARVVTVAFVALLSPQSSVAQQDPVRDCRREGDAARVIRGCTAVIEHGKRIGGYPEAWVFVNRALAYEQIGEYRKAIVDYDLAIKLDPKNPVGYMIRGNAYVKLGDFVRGLGDLKHARQIDESDHRIPYNLGVAEESRGNFDAAVSHYSEAIRLKPDFVNGYNNRANVYCRLERVQESMDDRLASMSLGVTTPRTSQRFLRALGYYDGPATASMDAATINALRRWTRDGCPQNQRK
ncbi:MAG: tetratricopeptide repeat protein [Burkholderiales bacterium]|nr:tetratricopeptide repeat protein [Burkholderiales bacterium]